MTRGLAPALVVLLLVSIVASACSSAAPAPAPSTAPASTSSAPSPSASASSQASKPAGSAAPSSAAKPDWKAEWDKLVAAAKQEGKVVVRGGAGDRVRDGMLEFQKAYPDIKIEFMGGPGGEAVAGVLAEQEAGLFLTDAWAMGADTALTSLLPKNGAAPLRPALILPEVLDDSKWHGGFEDGWMDLKRQYVYQALGYLTPGAMVNRKVAPESALSSFDQLVDPTWKGKIAWLDPRSPGSGSNNSSRMLKIKGEEWLRKLLANDIVVHKDSRALLEGLIRGSYAVAIGTRRAEVMEFKEQGVADHIDVLDPNNPLGTDKSGGTGHLVLMRNAPHPNAAKVFVNWFLTKGAQQTYAQLTGQNSRRLDAEGGPADTALKPGVTYFDVQKEENIEVGIRAKQLAREYIK